MAKAPPFHVRVSAVCHVPVKASDSYAEAASAPRIQHAAKAAPCSMVERDLRMWPKWRQLASTHKC